MSSPVFYFAYGSNMSSLRFLQRIPNAKVVGVSSLSEHVLRFHKPGSIDGTGKCDASFTGDERDKVWGVVYEISHQDLQLLHQIEGVGQGYDYKQARFKLTHGDISAYFYFATITDPNILPYHWYKEHVLRGAREHHLPASYIRAIEAVESIADRDEQRHQGETWIYD